MTPTKEECETLYVKHAPSVFRRAQRILGNDADAEEVVHDVFVSLFDRPERYAAARKLSVYLYGAVTNACLNRLRDQRNRSRLLHDHQRDGAAAHDPGLGPLWSVAARAALASMPKELAVVAVYHHVDELSHREIARVLGCSHRHVGHLLERLREWAVQQERVACSS